MRIHLEIENWTNFWDTGIPDSAWQQGPQDPETLVTEIEITDPYWQQLFASWLEIKKDMERKENEW